jgi:hypothetical protein
VNVFQQAGAAYRKDETADLSIVLKSKPRKIDKRYNLPVADEIAVLIPTINTEIAKTRDVIVIAKNGSEKLQRISDERDTVLNQKNQKHISKIYLFLI